MELVNLLAEMFSTYLKDLTPAIGLFAGIHVVLGLIYSTIYRPFDKL